MIAVDVTVGFCSEGALSSERVGSIVPPIVEVFRKAHNLGVRHFNLSSDIAILFGWWKDNGEKLRKTIEG